MDLIFQVVNEGLALRLQECVSHTICRTSVNPTAAGCSVLGRAAILLRPVSEYQYSEQIKPELHLLLTHLRQTACLRHPELQNTTEFVKGSFEEDDETELR